MRLSKICKEEVVHLKCGVSLVSQTSFSDERGLLQVGEVASSLPFLVRRYFFVTSVPEGAIRGRHAHKKCQQFLICLKGSVECEIRKNGHVENLFLDDSKYGVYFPEMTWATQFNYSKDAILLVLASEKYNQEDYIHSFDEFERLEKVIGHD